MAQAQAIAMTATLSASTASPAAVGTLVTFTAASPDSGTGTLWYRFRARKVGGDFHVIRDYSPLNSLDWTAAEHDGTFEVQVDIRNIQSGDQATSSMIYEMTAIASGNMPVITPTANPLIFYFSAGPCPAGQRMRVDFWASPDTHRQTPFLDCEPGRSMNFYIAGLLPSTSYTAAHVIDTGVLFQQGPQVSFASGAVPAPPFSQSVLQAAAEGSPDGVLLGCSFAGPTATDLSGNLLWYATNGIGVITRAERGGVFWGIDEGSPDPQFNRIRKFDLTGRTLLETNAARVNEQLAAMGKRQINAFHHEARTLPDGRIAVLGDVEQVMSDVQGPGPVNILGDMIIVLDRELNVVWTWDTFDFLDVTRAAVLGETCSNSGACAPIHGADANDWTHGNALQQTPDGHMLYSSRHQDWLIKINYANGEGDGTVIWRLGKDGDFQIDSDDPYPWFSHQHDGHFDLDAVNNLMVFDDGNTRVSQMGGNSRGQVLKLDERNRIATLVLSADLGVYSLAVGSAEKLRNGNYEFDAGFVYDTSSPGSYSAYSQEVDPFGNLVSSIKANTILYRVFRMTDLYTPN